MSLYDLRSHAKIQAVSNESRVPAVLFQQKKKKKKKRKISENNRMEAQTTGVPSSSTCEAGGWQREK